MGQTTSSAAAGLASQQQQQQQRDASEAQEGRQFRAQTMSYVARMESKALLSTNLDHANPLTDAATRGSVSNVEQLLQRHGIDVNVHSESGETALHIAARLNNPELVALLLRRGAQPEPAASGSGQTPLMAAVASKSTNAVAELLRCDAVSLNTTDFDGRTAVHHALRHYDSATMRQLLERRPANIHVIAPRTRETLLHCAAQLADSSHFEMLAMLRYMLLDQNAADVVPSLTGKSRKKSHHQHHQKQQQQHGHGQRRRPGDGSSHLTAQSLPVLAPEQLAGMTWCTATRFTLLFPYRVLHAFRRRMRRALKAYARGVVAPLSPPETATGEGKQWVGMGELAVAALSVETPLCGVARTRSCRSTIATDTLNTSNSCCSSTFRPSDAAQPRRARESPFYGAPPGSLVKRDVWGAAAAVAASGDRTPSLQSGGTLTGEDHLVAPTSPSQGLTPAASFREPYGSTGKKKTKRLVLKRRPKPLRSSRSGCGVADDCPSSLANLADLTFATATTTPRQTPLRGRRDADSSSDAGEIVAACVASTPPISTARSPGRSCSCRHHGPQGADGGHDGATAAAAAAAAPRSRLEQPTLFRLDEYFRAIDGDGSSGSGSDDSSEGGEFSVASVLGFASGGSDSGQEQEPHRHVTVKDEAVSTEEHLRRQMEYAWGGSALVPAWYFALSPPVHEREQRRLAATRAFAARGLLHPSAHTLDLVDASGMSVLQAAAEAASQSDASTVRIIMGLRTGLTLADEILV